MSILEFKSASDLWSLMFADARVFRQHFLDCTILYVTYSSCCYSIGPTIPYSNMATQVPPSTTPTPFADRPAPPTKDLEIPEDYKKTFRVGI